jgi:hypothetical protein
MVRLGTTNRSPSTEASRPSPQCSTIGTRPWASMRAAFAAGDGVGAQVVLVDVDLPAPGERLVVRVDDGV